MDIRDIARISGYSVGTVSRVLNGHMNVSDKARDHVMHVVDAYHFEPNASARELKRLDKTAIVVFVKGKNNLLFATILEKIHDLLHEQNEEVCVMYLAEDENEVELALRYQQARNPRGIIFLGGELKYFQESFSRISCSSVLITNNCSRLHFPNLSSVLTDDAKGASDIADVLIRAGHKKIAILGGNLSSGQISRRRLSGAIRRFAHAGIAVDLDRCYEPCHFSMEEGYEAAARLFERVPDCTAVFALADVIAMGAMRYVFDQGRSVPDDVSLVGFDGIEPAKYAYPRLTTVEQDTSQLAEAGVHALLRMIDGKEPVQAARIVPHCVLMGETVHTMHTSQ